MLFEYFLSLEYSFNGDNYTCIHENCTSIFCILLQLFALSFMHCSIDSLNEEEFGEASENFTYDENTTTAAMNLGLLVSQCILLMVYPEPLVSNFVFNGCLAGGEPGDRCLLFTITTYGAYDKAIFYSRKHGVRQCLRTK